MGLWIRSQDKRKLIKVDEIKMETIKEGNTFIYSHATDLGDYATKERALEVLDEIQKYLEKMGTNEILTNEVGIINGMKHYGIVYEMPEE